MYNEWKRYYLLGTSCLIRRCTYSITETFVTKSKIPYIVTKTDAAEQEGENVTYGLLADYTDINLSGLKIHEPLA